MPQDDFHTTIHKLEARIGRLMYLRDDLTERLKRQAREIKERERGNKELRRLHHQKLEQMEKEKDNIRRDLEQLRSDTSVVRLKQSDTQKAMLGYQQRKHKQATRFRPVNDGNQHEQIVRDLREQSMAGHRTFEHREPPRGRESKDGVKSSRALFPPQNAGPTSASNLHVGKAVLEFLNMA